MNPCGPNPVIQVMTGLTSLCTFHKKNKTVCVRAGFIDNTQNTQRYNRWEPQVKPQVAPRDESPAGETSWKHARRRRRNGARSAVTAGGHPRARRGQQDSNVAPTSILKRENKPKDADELH